MNTRLGLIETKIQIASRSEEGKGRDGIRVSYKS